MEAKSGEKVKRNGSVFITRNPHCGSGFAKGKIVNILGISALQNQKMESQCCKEFRVFCNTQSALRKQKVECYFVRELKVFAICDSHCRSRKQKVISKEPKGFHNPHYGK